MGTRRRDLKQKALRLVVNRIGLTRGNLNVRINWGKLRVGDVVCKKDLYKRLKSDKTFVGPSHITRLLDKRRVPIESGTRPGRSGVILSEDVRDLGKQRIRERVVDNREEV